MFIQARKETGAWPLRQQATYASDATHRWMGSVAMKGLEDMAPGSCNSRSLYPLVRFTVNGAMMSGYTHPPASNRDPEGDSNGTSILVTRP